MGRPVEDLATRFERLVDRAGDHHLWLGSVNPSRGTGRIKVGSVSMTAHRVAWELVNGTLSPSQRVVACTANPACVRIEHLSLEGVHVSPPRRPRARKGAGSKRSIRRGTWEL